MAPAGEAIFLAPLAMALSERSGGAVASQGSVVGAVVGGVAVETVLQLTEGQLHQGKGQEARHLVFAHLLVLLLYRP